MAQIKAYAAQSATSPLGLMTLQRRTVGATDVQIEILYCGICHSDIHIARNEWSSFHPALYPIVPGHEIVGIVTQVGSSVKSFKIDDRVMVGCMVDSCRKCPSCKQGLEQYCEKGNVLTYNTPDPKHQNAITYGGYSTRIVVDEAFVLRVPHKFTPSQLPNLAPLVCAGITTYSPLRHWKIGKGSKVGVIGLGGLGHMALQHAHAMGAEVTLFTSSPSKIQDGKKLGAHHVILSKQPEEMKKVANHFDFILNTAAGACCLDPFMESLKRDGTLCIVGLPSSPPPVPSFANLIFKRRQIAGSLIGGIKETQEMLDFCAEHNIVSQVEIIPIQQVNAAYKRTVEGDVKYRFVIDMASLK